MFFRFLARALRYRLQRLLLAFSALAVAATLATVLFGIYGTAERRIRDEFGAYGANIVAVPATGTTLPLALVDAAERMGAHAAPFLITAGVVGGHSVPVAGFEPRKAASMTTYWHVRGRREMRAGECLAGESAAHDLGVTTGSRIAIDDKPCTVAGIVSTGGAEDGELLVPYAMAAALAGLSDVASAIEIRAPGERVELVRSALAKQFPEADVRTVRSVAGTESSVVLKIRAALLLLTLAILSITTLCVSSNFTEMVIERSKEIGIMKALGAAESRIAGLFVSESATLAVAATLTGYAAGTLTAAAIGREIFGGVFQPRPEWWVLGSVTAVMLSVAAVATAIAASRIWSIEPAIILRGE